MLGVEYHVELADRSTLSKIIQVDSDINGDICAI